jgi:RND family efflux transporter MFP subunit
MRVLLPSVVLLLAGLMLAYSARDAVFPARPVRVVRVVAREAAPAATGGAAAPAELSSSATAAVAVQAPGWIEPDPYPVFVSALTPGVIDRVLVLEGEPVKVNQEVALMVPDDARLALARAEAELARRKALRDAAQTDWDNPIALVRMVAVSRAMLAEAKAELAQLGAMIAEKAAMQSEAQAIYDRVRKLLPNAASQQDVEQAQFRLDAQRAAVESTQKLRPVLEAKVARYEAELKAAEEDLRLRVALRRALDEAEAALAEAQAARDEAKLRLSRMTITSPVAGVVMQRLVAPGAKIMLDGDMEHSAHILHVYDPKKLQVRTDVPLAEAAKVGVGQRAKVIVDVLPDQEFAGVVTRFVHQADIGKNTVQVKVSIESPSPLLKPDMLARVKFLSTGGGAGESVPAAGASVSTLAIYAPLSAVQRHGEHPQVWLVAAGNRLRPQPVALGVARDDGWVAVVEGLRPGDVLVAEPAADLKEGERVNPIEPP